MNVDIIQTGIDASFDLRQGETSIGCAEISPVLPCNMEATDPKGKEAAACLLTLRSHRITVQPQERKRDDRKKSLLWRLLFREQDLNQTDFQILLDGQMVGRFCSSHEVERLNELAHHVMEFNCFCYTLYRVGRGGEGIDFPVYEGDMQIGVIKKPYTSRASCSYHIAAVDSTALTVSILFALYESICSGGQSAHFSPYLDALITTDEALIAKNNLDFEKTLNLP